MTSSKFNRHPVPRLRPAICIAPAGSCLPLYDGRTPANLWSFLHWRDLDPVSEMDAAGIVPLGPRSGGGLYIGEITIGNVRLGARVQDHYPAPSVDVTMTYWDPFWLDQTWDFPNVPMPLDLPFNTHRLHYVNIPGKDFRLANVTE